MVEYILDTSGWGVNFGAPFHQTCMEKLFPKAIICIVHHCKCIVNLKILIFHVYFVNKDISLIIALISLRTCMCVVEIGFEGKIVI